MPGGHVRGVAPALDSSTAKLWCTEMHGRVVDQCLRFHGAYGLMREYESCRLDTDARSAHLRRHLGNHARTDLAESLELCPVALPTRPALMCSPLPDQSHQLCNADVSASLLPNRLNGIAGLTSASLARAFMVKSGPPSCGSTSRPHPESRPGAAAFAFRAETSELAHREFCLPFRGLGGNGVMPRDLAYMFKGLCTIERFATSSSPERRSDRHVF